MVKKFKGIPSSPVALDFTDFMALATSRNVTFLKEKSIWIDWFEGVIAEVTLLGEVEVLPSRNLLKSSTLK